MIWRSLLVSVSRFERALDWALAAAALSSVYVIFQSYGLDPFNWQGGVPDWRGKLTGTFGGPNFVAGYVAVIFPWGVYRFLSANRETAKAPEAPPPAPSPSAAAAFSALVPMIACLFVTFSVGAWTGLAAAALLAGTVAVVARRSGKPNTSAGRPTGDQGNRTKPPQHPPAPGGAVDEAQTGLPQTPKKTGQGQQANLMRRILLLVGITIVIGGFYLLDVPWNNAGRSLVREAMDSARWRTGHEARRFIWKTTALMVRDHPILGVGFGNYFRVHQIYQGELYLERGLPHDRPQVSLVPQVHNEYYQHLAETGVVGFVALAWLIAAGVGVMARRWRDSTGPERNALLAVYAGLGVGAVHALSSFPLRIPPTALLLAVLLSYALSPRSAVNSRQVTLPRVRYLLIALLPAAAYAGAAPAVASVFMQRSLAGSFPDAEAAAKVWPFSQQTNDFAARMAARSRDPEAALAWSERALRYREAFRTREFRRDIYLALGDLKAAAEEGDRALRLNPMYPPLVLEQARLRKSAGLPYADLLDRAEMLLRGLRAEGKAAEAAWTARAIIKLDPDRADRVRRKSEESTSG